MIGLEHSFSRTWFQANSPAYDFDFNLLDSLISDEGVALCMHGAKQPQKVNKQYSTIQTWISFYYIQYFSSGPAAGSRSASVARLNPVFQHLDNSFEQTLSFTSTTKSKLWSCVQQSRVNKDTILFFSVKHPFHRASRECPMVDSTNQSAPGQTTRSNPCCGLLAFHQISSWCAIPHWKFA